MQRMESFYFIYLQSPLVEAVDICYVSDLEQLVIHERDSGSSAMSDSSPGSGTCPLSALLGACHCRFCQVQLSLCCAVSVYLFSCMF